MEESIQLIHPAGKKAVNMPKVKYETIKNALLNCLETNGELTHTELLLQIKEDFKKRRTEFEGSVEWYVEWVKLDLEARSKIRRLGDKQPLKYAIAH